MKLRFLIGLAVMLMLSYYGSSDAYAQRARPSAQPDIEGETALPPAIGRGGRGGAAMGQAGAQRGPGGVGGGHGHGGGNTNPLFAAIDQNQDGQISLAELRAAAAVIKTLDKNGDGLLSLAECAPAGGGGHGHGGGHGGGAADPQAEATATVKTLMEFDLNGDGALTKDELPERMQNVIVRADSDGNGVATRDELMAMTLKEAAPAPASAGGRGRGRFRPSATTPQTPSDDGGKK
jgi:Ca2+-binding EF-hand superfamily protein